MSDLTKKVKTDKKQTEIENNENEDSFLLNWTWYVLLGFCFLLLLGFALTWIMSSKEITTISNYYIPSLICSLIAIVLLGLFFYYDTKDFNLIKFHVPRKLFKFYYSSLIVFMVGILFAIVYLFCYPSSISTISNTTFYVIGLVILCLITLVGIGLYRYARYKIDLAIYLRKHGKTVSEAKVSETNNSSSSEKASSGLTDAAKK